VFLCTVAGDDGDVDDADDAGDEHEVSFFEICILFKVHVRNFLHDLKSPFL
jgi:hypothetical protein